MTVLQKKSFEVHSSIACHKLFVINVKEFLIRYKIKSFAKIHYNHISLALSIKKIARSLTDRASWVSHDRPLPKPCCLYNASFLPLISANAFYFHALSLFIDT